jgi:MFS-type transporter involved in bile tolerance (Atg22 family)
MKLAATIALLGGALAALLANTIDLSAALVVALVLLILTAAIVVAIRTDQRRNQIPTRLAVHRRARTPAAH